MNQYSNKNFHHQLRSLVLAEFHSDSLDRLLTNETPISSNRQKKVIKCKFLGAKESSHMRKEFNSHVIFLYTFVGYIYQYGCRDVM